MLRATGVNGGTSLSAWRSCSRTSHSTGSRETAAKSTFSAVSQHGVFAGTGPGPGPWPSRIPPSRLGPTRDPFFICAGSPAYPWAAPYQDTLLSIKRLVAFVCPSAWTKGPRLSGSVMHVAAYSYFADIQKAVGASRSARRGYFVLVRIHTRSEEMGEPPRLAT